MQRIFPASTRLALFIGLLIILAVGGCRPPVLQPVWRPWTRTIGNSQDVRPGRFTISTEGKELTLVGAAEASEAVLSDLTTSMLERRGFTAVGENPDYQIRLSFRTEARDAVVSSSFVQTRSSSSSVMAARGAAAGASSGGSALGVAIAALVGATGSASQSTVAQNTDTETRYHHALALEILGRDGNTLWKGDAAWWSRNLDILDEALLPLQLLVADLPNSGTVKPEIPRVRSTRIKTFYRLYCDGRWFSSPAVPYRVRFDSYSSKVNNQEAYMAYLDVLERSEQVVPIGEDDYSDVTDRDLWDDLQLGGEYLLGPIREPVKVILTLEKNNQGGYDVDRARIATEGEYAAFLDRLERWRAALAEYYSVFD